MKNEIERKFLLKNDSWRQKVRGTSYRQGYIVRDPSKTVRIRTCNNKGFLTIKGLGNGISRTEFEYEIPFTDANLLLSSICDQPLLEKIRYRVGYKGFIWEIDEFLGDNSGLFLAEIELTAEDQIFPKPGWLGIEVTGIPRYYNASLVKFPFKDWED